MLEILLMHQDLKQFLKHIDPIIVSIFSVSIMQFLKHNISKSSVFVLHPQTVNGDQENLHEIFK